jgi:hypothetical protein
MDGLVLALSLSDPRVHVFAGLVGYVRLKAGFWRSFSQVWCERTIAPAAEARNTSRHRLGSSGWLHTLWNA